MNILSSNEPLRRATSVSIRAASIAALMLSVAALAGCSSISEVTKQRVASSGVSVQQAQEAVGRTEEAMMELQHARESLDAAQKAAARADDVNAQRMSTRAELHAHLAVAQAQSADARRAADAVSAGTDALRKESERASTATAPTP